MDRALLYPKSKVQEFSDKLDLGRVKKFSFLTESSTGLGGWFINIPFEVIPENFIRQIARDPVTPYEKYLEYCPWLNAMLTIWNSCLINEEREILAFSYGDWDPLLSHMQVIRFSIRPKLFRIDGTFWKDAFDACKIHANLLGVEKIYWISCSWKAILRKVPDEVVLKDTRVMEVKNV